MILVLGGTHEGREIATLLNTMDLPFILSVTTDLGEALYRDVAANCECHRFTADALLLFITERNIKLVIDATHPHAAEIKQTASEVCQKAQTPYWRYARTVSSDISGDSAIDGTLMRFDSMQTAIAYLKTVIKDSQRMLITGTKHIPEFLNAFPATQMVFRIMPGRASMEACMAHNIPIENIIAIKAPCSVRLNQCLFEDYGISYFVFKNSGTGSAFASNVEALNGTSVIGIVIEPKPLYTAHTIESIEALRLQLKECSF